jgi:hypothetical protein
MPKHHSRTFFLLMEELQPAPQNPMIDFMHDRLSVR